MKKFKVLAVLLVMFAVGLVLTGCPQDPPEEPTTEALR